MLDGPARQILQLVHYMLVLVHVSLLIAAAAWCKLLIFGGSGSSGIRVRSWPLSAAHYISRFSLEGS